MMDFFTFFLKNHTLPKCEKSNPYFVNSVGQFGQILTVVKWSESLGLTKVIFTQKEKNSLVVLCCLHMLYSLSMKLHSTLY